jgi:hypothetical protein
MFARLSDQTLRHKSFEEVDARHTMNESKNRGERCHRTSSVGCIKNGSKVPDSTTETTETQT